MNNLLINTDKNTGLDTSIIILAVLLLITCVVIVLITLFYFFYWLKHSLFCRKNNKRFNGAVFARKTMQHYGVQNPNVVSAWVWGGYKMWNYNRRQNKLTLKRWTYSRKSRWTLNESMENGYFATLIQKNDKRIWLYRFASKLAGFLSFGAFILGFYLILPLLFSVSKSASLQSWEVNIFTILFVGIVFITSWIAVIWRVEILKKSKSFLDDSLKKGDITLYEYTVIRRILKLRLWYAVAEAIYHSLQLALRIMIKYSNKFKR